MASEAHIYSHMKSAIARAEEKGFTVVVNSDHLRLYRKDGKREPGYNFHTGSEIHSYINGLEDGVYNEALARSKETA